MPCLFAIVELNVVFMFVIKRSMSALRLFMCKERASPLRTIIMLFLLTRLYNIDKMYKDIVLFAEMPTIFIGTRREFWICYRF